MTDNCTMCGDNKISSVKIVMYYANSKPIYYKLCDRCIKEKWKKVKLEIKREVSK